MPKTWFIIPIPLSKLITLAIYGFISNNETFLIVILITLFNVICLRSSRRGSRKESNAASHITTLPRGDSGVSPGYEPPNFLTLGRRKLQGVDELEGAKDGLRDVTSL